MRTFDFYEFAAILVPGAVALLGVAFLVPAVRVLTADPQLATLGALVVIAYACGHLVQVLGDLLESVWWRLRGGIPSDWVRNPARALISPAQRAALLARLRERHLLADTQELSEPTLPDWHSITRQVYAVVRKSGLSDRVDTFNGNYGLNRGLAAALLALLPFLLARLWIAPGGDYAWIGLLVLSCAALFLSRMDSFGQHYARELYVQFIESQ